MSSTRNAYLRGNWIENLSYEDVMQLYNDRYGMDGVDITGQYSQSVSGITTNIPRHITNELPLTATISTARELPNDGRYYYYNGGFSIMDEYDVEISDDVSSIRLVRKEKSGKEPNQTLTSDQQQKFLDLI